MISFTKKVDEFDVLKFLKYLETENFKVINVDIVDVPNNGIVDYVIESPSKFIWDIYITKKYFKLMTNNLISLTISFDEIINNNKEIVIAILNNPIDYIKNDDV